MKLIHLVAGAAVALGITAGPAYADQSAYCAAYAQDYADRNVDTSQIVGLGIFGTLGGMAICGLTGSKNVGACAAAGGAAGVSIGIIRSSQQWRDLYDQTYWSCMNPPVPPRGSRAWNQACAEKYRYQAFSWKSGTFRGFDGQRYTCQLP